MIDLNCDEDFCNHSQGEVQEAGFLHRETNAFIVHGDKDLNASFQRICEESGKTIRFRIRPLFLVHAPRRTRINYQLIHTMVWGCSVDCQSSTLLMNDRPQNNQNNITCFIK